MLTIGFSEVIIAILMAVIVLRPGDYSYLIKLYRDIFNKINDIKKDISGVGSVLKEPNKIIGDDGKEYDFFSLDEVERMVREKKDDRDKK